MPWLGEGYVAELRVPAAGAIRYERTTKSRGHYTLWGDPEVMRRSVVRVTPIRSQDDDRAERLEQDAQR